MGTKIKRDRDGEQMYNNKGVRLYRLTLCRIWWR
jgi:hypothetical protein